MAGEMDKIPDSRGRAAPPNAGMTARTGSDPARGMRSEDKD
jgi:hypothetical protein